MTPGMHHLTQPYRDTKAWPARNLLNSCSLHSKRLDTLLQALNCVLVDFTPYNLFSKKCLYKFSCKTDAC